MQGDYKTYFPNPKINLGLIIKGKRADGYHLLETLYYPIDFVRDTLVVRKTAKPGCTLVMKGYTLDGEIQDNLCVKAYEALKQKVPEISGVQLELTKAIPAGAGLGGGSSDAAFTLTGINEVLGLGFSLSELAEMGETLGADVPFFLYNRPLLAKGIGTEFEEWDLDLPYEIRVRTSPIHSSTVAAYKNLDLDSLDLHRDLKSLLALPINQWKKYLPNDLEGPVFALHPELEEAKRQLYREGAVYAAMSGSGSAVFGLFEN